MGRQKLLALVFFLSGALLKQQLPEMIPELWRLRVEPLGSNQHLTLGLKNLQQI
jgi:hypothetical protein